MQIIAILLAVLIVGVLVFKQLGPGSKDDRYEQVRESTGVEAPRVPTRPAELKSFEQQMNVFVQDSAADRARRMEETERNSYR